MQLYFYITTVFDAVDCAVVFSNVDCIVQLYDIEVFQSEIVAFSKRRSFGNSINLLDGYLIVAFLGRDGIINAGDYAYRTLIELVLGVHFSLIGRIVDPICEFLDGELELIKKPEPKENVTI